MFGAPIAARSSFIASYLALPTLEASCRPCRHIFVGVTSEHKSRRIDELRNATCLHVGFFSTGVVDVCYATLLILRQGLIVLVHAVV